jgi:hypothetical protein
MATTETAAPEPLSKGQRWVHARLRGVWTITTIRAGRVTMKSSIPFLSNHRAVVEDFAEGGEWTRA